MGSTIASQITSLTIVYSTVYSDADQRKHQSSASLAFVRGIHRGPVNSPHKWPVTLKTSPFDDVIMLNYNWKIGHELGAEGVSPIHHVQIWCFPIFCCDYTPGHFIHVLQGYFTGHQSNNAITPSEAILNDLNKYTTGVFWDLMRKSRQNTTKCTAEPLI